MLKSFQNRFLLIWLLGIIMYIPLMENFNAWFDEQFSLYLTSLSWRDMFHVNMSEDGHPPLHYILLRLWNWGRDFHDVGWARFLSLFLLSLTALLGAFPVRRLLGDTIALWFTAFVFLFPRSLFLGTDMRMYGLLNLEITAMVIYALLALRDGKTGDWLKFLVASLCALYTHYFGALTLAVLDIFLFFALIRKKKNLKKQMSFLFGTAIISGLAFLPWFVVVFLGQASKMYTDWYPDLNSLFNTFGSFLIPAPFPLEKIPAVLLALFSSLMWLLLIQATSDKKTKHHITVCCIVFLFFGVLAIATLFSLTIRPMMSWRYLTPYAGALALALATIISHETRFKKIFLILLFSAFVSSYTARFTMVYDSFYRQFQTKIRTEINPKDSIFLTTEDGVSMIMFFYLPEYTRYYTPLMHRLNVPSQVLKTILPEEQDTLKEKNIFMFHAGKHCENPMTNEYDHGAKLCIKRLSSTDAKFIIEHSKQYWKNKN